MDTWHPMLRQKRRRRAIIGLGILLLTLGAAGLAVIFAGLL